MATGLASLVAVPALPVMVDTVTAPVDPLTLVTGKVIAWLLALITLPLASMVSTGSEVAVPYTPPVTPDAANVSAEVTLADPSKLVDQVPSPVMLIVRAVLS